MKTITIDGKDIEISNESYNEFKKQFVSKDPRWTPEKGELYHYVSEAGLLLRCLWANDTVDKFRLSQGNVFKTEKESKDHLCA